MQGPGIRRVGGCDVTDDYTTSGCIPDVLRGRVRDLRRGRYSFADILDLAAHHLVYTGEAADAEERLRRVADTVREFLRERYGVWTGPGDDRADARRFRLWLSDARGRYRWFRREEKRREQWRALMAWRGEAPAMLM